MCLNQSHGGLALAVATGAVKDHGAGCQQNVWNGELQTFNGRFALFSGFGVLQHC